MRKHFIKVLVFTISLTFFSSPLFAWPPSCLTNDSDSRHICPDDEALCPTGGKGAELLVKALNRAYVRVLDPAYPHAKGEENYWDIYKHERINKKFDVSVFDCYPYEEETEFPTWQVVNETGGLLACILERGSFG